MFEHTSRYYALETATYDRSEGEAIAYKRRRFLPPIDKMQTLAEVTVTQGDRLDLITARTLGDPEQFWWIADANSAMNPPDLTHEVGRKLRIPMPQL